MLLFTESLFVYLRVDHSDEIYYVRLEVTLGFFGSKARKISTMFVFGISRISSSLTYKREPNVLQDIFYLPAQSIKSVVKQLLKYAT